MSIIRAKIYRQTRSRQYWVGRTEAGQEMLFPADDQRLGIGVDVDVEGIRKGEHVDFPVRYGLKGQIRPRTPICTGVIKEDHVDHGKFGTLDFWEATTDSPERAYMNLNKRRGPSDVDLGTVVEIYNIAKMGIRHTFVDEWDKAARQYPSEPLTEEQRTAIEKLRPDFRDAPVVGTLALRHPPFATVVLDEFQEVRWGKRRTTDLYTPQNGNFPIGTRLLVGVSKDVSPRRLAQKI